MARGIPKDVIRHFQAIPLFGALSTADLRAVVQAATEIDVHDGKVLVREGERGRELFVILRGTAVVAIGGKKVRELVPGEFFGELALLHPAPRSATVTARTDMRVMVLGAREMEVIVDRQPLIARRLLEAMAKRLRANEQTSSSH